MRVRDEPFTEPVPLGRRIASIVLTVLAMPFIVMGDAIWSLVLMVLPAITRLLMVITAFLVIPAAAFAYRHDWNSAAQVAVMFLVIGAIAGGLRRILSRSAALHMRLR